MGRARDFKFSVHIDLQACKPKNAKVDQEGLDVGLILGYLYQVTNADMLKPSVMLNNMINLINCIMIE